jgi:hypothetical protein
MREVRTIDGWVDADYRPAKPPRHRPRNAVLAARRFALGLFIADHQHREGCKLESTLEAATKKFHCTRKHALAALAEFRRDLPVETSTYVGPPGSRPMHRVRGVDGRWREVPAARISCLPTSGDSTLVVDQTRRVISKPCHQSSGAWKWKRTSG